MRKGPLRAHARWVQSPTFEEQEEEVSLEERGDLSLFGGLNLMFKYLNFNRLWII